jgi:hypothetical protein
VSVYVQLPKKDQIDCFAFVRSITKATVPDMNPNGTGLECIVGKLVAQCIPGIEKPLLSERSLECDDLKFLNQVLPKLPELRIPLFENVAEAFMGAYRELKERPTTWEPVLITEARYMQERDKRSSERWALFEQHQKELQRRSDRGEIGLCDRNHLPVADVKLGAMIQYKQAVAYLKDCQIACLEDVPRVRNAGDIWTKENIAALGNDYLANFSMEYLMKKYAAHKSNIYEKLDGVKKRSPAGRGRKISLPTANNPWPGHRDKVEIGGN